MSQRWCFLLPKPTLGGGMFVIFEHALRASNSGIMITMITEDILDLSELDWHNEAKNLRWVTYDEIKTEIFDVAIATYWKTVYSISQVNASYYAYFVQSIESRFYAKSEKIARAYVDATYTLNLNVITEATWIKEYLKSNYDIDAFLARNGIRKDLFRLEGHTVSERVPGRLRVLVEGPTSTAIKNVPKTVELCRRSNADEIWLLTSSKISKYPHVDRIFSCVPIQDTAAIYRSCDVIVKLSYVEGMFGPPLEMFHCGGTAITYDVSGHDEYILHKENAFVAQKDDEKMVINFINLLKSNSELLATMKNAAINTAVGWPDWEESSNDFITAVNNIVIRNYSPTKEELSGKIAVYREWYTSCEFLLEPTFSEKISLFFIRVWKKICRELSTLGDRKKYA